MNVAIRHLRSPSQLHRLRPCLLLTNTHSILHHPKLLLPQNPPPSSLASLGYCTSSLASLGYCSSRLYSTEPLLRLLLLDDKDRFHSTVYHYGGILPKNPPKILALARNADLLCSLGLSDKTELASFVYKSPLLLFLSPNRLSAAFSVAKREFNLGPDFVYAVSLAAVLREDGFLSRIGMLRRFGFKDKELMRLCRRVPRFMRLSEEHMERKLEFLTGEVGMGPGEMLLYEWVMMLSLETRVVPRCEIMKGLRERGLLVEGEMDVWKTFLMDEDEFRKKFVERFEDDEGAELVKAYLRSSTAKVEMKEEEEEELSPLSCFWRSDLEWIEKSPFSDSE